MVSNSGMVLRGDPGGEGGGIAIAIGSLSGFLGALLFAFSSSFELSLSLVVFFRDDDNPSLFRQFPIG